jgi:hypothetical protein
MTRKLKNNHDGSFFKCPFVWYLVSPEQEEKTNNAGTSLVPDYVDAVWHFLVWYQTEITNARL